MIASAACIEDFAPDCFLTGRATRTKDPNLRSDLSGGYPPRRECQLNKSHLRASTIKEYFCSKYVMLIRSDQS